MSLGGGSGVQGWHCIIFRWDVKYVDGQGSQLHVLVACGIRSSLFMRLDRSGFLWVFYHGHLVENI